MIDYIKAYFPDKNEIFGIMKDNYNLEKISYTRFDKTENALVSYETYKKEFENMELKITNQGAYIHNSLHHFYNKVVYGIDGNYNDFKHSSLVNAIDFLEDRIKFPVDKLELSQGLEFGLNLRVPFDLDEFIVDQCILFDFCEVSKFPPPTEEQVYKEFQKGNYRLKVYHKGRQQCLYGKGLVSAHDIAEAQQWAGCIVHDSIINDLLSEPGGLEFIERLAVKYNVPFKENYFQEFYAFKLKKGKINNEDHLRNALNVCYLLK